MAFFALGLEKVSLFSNRKIIGSAEVRFHSFVADEQLSLPGAEAIQTERDSAARREIVRELVPAVIGKWETIPIQNIPDRHTFTFGDSGRILYRSSIIPTSLDWMMLVIEDDRDIQDLGSDIEEFFTDDRLDSAAGAIMTLAGVASSPAAAAGIVLGKMVVKGITFVTQNNEDDQLGVIEQSFIRPLHYPAGTRHGVSVGDLSGNMWYDYFISGTNEI